jgi:nucleoside-triphosphatase THEP1
MSTYDNASELEFFNNCLDTLTTELVREDLNVDVHSQKLDDFDDDSVGSVDDGEVEKSAWVASLLALSDDDEHRRKALAFGILSYTRHENTEKEKIYRKYLYIILSRLGNLPAFKNVDSTETDVSFENQLVKSLDSVLGSELIATRQEYEIELGPTLSAFQKDIYNHLREGMDIAISGPTSSGKSFILKKYIEYRIESDEGFEGIYIVPTRALISEVSREISAIDSITVRNGAYFEEHEEDEEAENTFLVVTPERCRKLIDPEVRNKIDPDLVFFDEVQNVEDESRGVLFEGIVQSLNEFYPSAQIVAAGPYLDNPGEALETLTNNEVAEVQTAFTPVVQLRVSLQFRPGLTENIKTTIHAPSGRKVTVDVPAPDDLTYTDVNQSKTKSLPILLSKYASNSKTLVYSGQKNHAEDRANLIAEDNEEQVLSPEVEELKEFLSTSIHKEYSLIDCLDRGVAFHHGNVPKVAREAIENIYSNTGDLHTIVTTPTLLQGVNLPAEKIFLVGANRGNKELTDFEFNNLIGRVGRIDTKLYGAIYCIETDDDEWADEKLEDAGEKEVEAATSKAISDSEQLIEALRQSDLSSVENSAIRYTAILLRGRYLKQGKSVEEYLESKDMMPKDRAEIHRILQSSLDEVDVPESILKKNPTLDPVNLNELYHSVNDDPKKWIISESRFEEALSR